MAPLKPRQDLKARFVRNAIPTEQDFQDLIDSPLNQSDDGVFRSSGEPLSVVATNEPQRRCVRLYWETPSGAAVPDWLISLNPPQTAAVAGSNQRGLGIADGAGNTRLFLNAAGNLGVGTNQPQEKLHVVGGGARLDGPLTVSGASTLSGLVTASGTLTVGGEFTASSRVTLGRADGSTELVVRGALQAARSDIYFTDINHQHTGFGNTDGYAAIENAISPYNALMILGRKTAGGRIVKLWDILEVNGKLDVNNGNLNVLGNSAEAGNLTVGRNLTVTGSIESRTNLKVDGSVTIGSSSTNPAGGSPEINLGQWIFRVNGERLDLFCRVRRLIRIGGGLGGGGVGDVRFTFNEKLIASFDASDSVSGSNRLTYP
jgi:cytoskeletal protein CcmA (bactofilin family)